MCVVDNYATSATVNSQKISEMRMKLDLLIVYPSETGRNISIAALLPSVDLPLESSLVVECVGDRDTVVLKKPNQK